MKKPTPLDILLKHFTQLPKKADNVSVPFLNPSSVDLYTKTHKEVKKPYADLEDLNNSFNVTEPSQFEGTYDEDAKAQDAVIRAYLKETLLKKPSLTRPIKTDEKDGKTGKTK
eukprot:TRINITY_DN3327_c0_g4_i11.p19 TRINITY_DN3327_c0_g4~~TRINITY_DN3327_c0_g4_i11.p19  ORF type:complete len:113 (-),score=0.80 TRINITY_DN3327_c0_g4_i11:6426-6764(-)